MVRGINEAMFSFGNTKSWSVKDLKKAIAIIEQHKTLGDDPSSQTERRDKRLRLKHLKALLKAQKATIPR